MRHAVIARPDGKAVQGRDGPSAPLRSRLAAFAVAAAFLTLPMSGHGAFDYATGAAEAPGVTGAAGAGGEPGAAGAGIPAEAPGLPAHECDAPSEIAPAQDPLPGLEKAFKEGSRPLTIVVLGSLSGDAGPKAQGIPGFAARLKAHLETELAARSLDSSVRVEPIGRIRALAADLADLMKREVLPMKPALVIWQVGRADARQSIPPSRFSQSLKEGLAILQEPGIAAIISDIQFHPQFEALYRTDDYRNYVRWVAGKRDLPLLRRYEMIEHWASAGSIDLDSANDADQLAAYRFIQECLAYQATRLILGAAGLATR